MAQSYRFDDVVVDPCGFRVIRAGKPVDLEPKALSVLVFLIENRGRLVDKRELIHAVWGDTFVTDNVLSRAIAQLRKGLADDAKVARYIETVPTRGYRFVAEVSVDHVGGGPPASAQAAGPSLTLVRQRRSWRWVSIPVGTVVGRARRLNLGIIFLATGAAGLVILLSGILGSSPKLHINSVAVLPMENLSRNPEQEYFADGMTDAVIAELARIGDLRVISRQSVMRYKGSAAPLRQIGKELNVDAIVEATVLQSGDRLRVTAKLVQVATDSHLWAQQYDRDVRDVLSLQADIARSIAEEVKVRLTPEQKTLLAKSRPPVNPRAYELYLRGHKEWYKLTEEGLRKSAQYFQQSLQIDPTYAPAYVGLAGSYAVLGQQEILPPSQAYALARQAVVRALELDDSLGDAHAVLGWIHRNYDWDWRGSEQEFRLSVKLSPGSAAAHHGYSAYLDVIGAAEESLREERRALELDPLSSFYAAQLGLVLADRGEYDEANSLLNKALELDPNNLRAHYGLGEVYAAKGNYESAIRELRRAAELPRGRLDVVARLAQLYIQSGHRVEALKLLYEVKRLGGRRYVSSLDVASLYAVLGRKDEAFGALEEAYKERSPFLLGIRTNRTLDNVRSDPRFADLVRRIGLPQMKGGGV